MMEEGYSFLMQQQYRVIVYKLLTNPRKSLTSKSVVAFHRLVRGNAALVLRAFVADPEMEMVLDLGALLHRVQHDVRISAVEFAIGN